MSHSFKPRTDILPPAQKALWSQLRPATELGFVLYGGTAIALRLGHRTSVDFDFFTEQPLDKKKLRQSLPFLLKSTTLQDGLDTLSALVGRHPENADSVKVSFFGSLDFGRVGKPDLTEDGVLQVASMDDLLASKLKVILQRAEAKDYLDIAALVGAGVPLGRGLSAARALYGSAFQPAESLKALVYFEGGDLSTLPSDVKTTLIGSVREIKRLPGATILSGVLSARIKSK